MKPVRIRHWLAALLLAFGLQAQGHTLSVSHLDIVVPADDGDLQVELDLALRDLALSLPLDANHDEQVTWGELLAAREPLENLVMSGLSLSTRAGRCEWTPRDLAIRRYDDGAYATLRMSARCPSVDALQVDYRLLFENDPQHRALVTVRRGGSVATGIARADAPRVVIPLAASSPFLDFLREGIHHILIGYDHLAFLVSLLLPAILVRRSGRWLPAANFRNSLLHVLGIVTAFTLAHSITLSLAALDLVRPASRVVEAGIAASVLLAAANNIKPVIDRRIWLVAFVFGLVHGFGFAGALGEVGLPTGARLQALVGFNVGVELGQLAVVSLLLPVLYAMRRRPAYAGWIMPLASSLIAALAAYWLWLRTFG